VPSGQDESAGFASATVPSPRGVLKVGEAAAASVEEDAAAGSGAAAALRALGVVERGRAKKAAGRPATGRLSTVEARVRHRRQIMARDWRCEGVVLTVGVWCAQRASLALEILTAGRMYPCGSQPRSQCQCEPGEQTAHQPPRACQSTVRDRNARLN
jgi:hypothetical protein